MCNNELIWIILILSLLGGGSCGCNSCADERSGNSCGCGNDIIPLILILLLLGGNGSGLTNLFGGCDNCG